MFSMEKAHCLDDHVHEREEAGHCIVDMVDFLAHGADGLCGIEINRIVHGRYLLNFLQNKRPNRVLSVHALSTLIVTLTLFLPRIQKLYDFFFHLPGRITARKVFAQSFVFDGYSVLLAFLFLAHNIDYGF